jgi:F0F1-type ATP synthase membrane subunit c/vacuolar-type H+-ATPase subunit K
MAPDAPLFNTAEPNRGFSAGVAAGLAELASGQAGGHIADDAAAAMNRVSKLLPLPFP